MGPCVCDQAFSFCGELTRPCLAPSQQVGAFSSHPVHLQWTESWGRQQN